MKAKILLVEDERNFGMVLKDYLQMNNYVVVHAEDGEQGLLAYKQENFDLCIVDVMMPKKDGFTLAQEIKSLQTKTPILFLTARTMREDMIKAYKIGADDYITKPFDSELLLYKIVAILNRSEIKASSTVNEYSIGSFSFNVKLRTLKCFSDAEIKLSPKEASLLQMLCEYKNDVLPREKALKHIWKEESYFTGRSMDVYIAKLRRHLQADPSIEINNLHGNGYTLTIK